MNKARNDKFFSNLNKFVNLYFDDHGKKHLEDLN